MSNDKNTGTATAVIATSKLTKSMLGGDDVTIYLTDINGNEIAQFGKSAELQSWLTREGYVYFTGSRGVWIKVLNKKESVA